jgi:hypothetical protein
VEKRFYQKFIYSNGGMLLLSLLFGPICALNSMISHCCAKAGWLKLPFYATPCHVAVGKRRWRSMQSHPMARPMAK